MKLEQNLLHLSNRSCRLFDNNNGLTDNSLLINYKLLNVERRLKIFLISSKSTYFKTSSSDDIKIILQAFYDLEIIVNGFYNF